jgi:hypothetical protein
MNPTAAGEDPVDRPVRPSAEALTVARILEIRDALLPSQGEPFDCVAFAVEIVKAERARLADECPAMPEPYTRQWINAPFTERLLFTEDQMRQYAADASAEARALADSEGTRAVQYLRRARKAEAALAAKNDDDQAWDRNAERITREALGDDVTRPINPNATSIDDL